jgi:hypothetical protein
MDEREKKMGAPTAHDSWHFRFSNVKEKKLCTYRVRLDDGNAVRVVAYLASRRIDKRSSRKRCPFSAVPCVDVGEVFRDLRSPRVVKPRHKPVHTKGDTERRKNKECARHAPRALSTKNDAVNDELREHHHGGGKECEVVRQKQKLFFFFFWSGFLLYFFRVKGAGLLICLLSLFFFGGGVVAMRRLIMMTGEPGNARSARGLRSAVFFFFFFLRFFLPEKPKKSRVFFSFLPEKPKKPFVALPTFGAPTLSPLLCLVCPSSC